MKISICMPAFGRYEMVKQAIYSILAQEHQDWEIIIRDDDPDKHSALSVLGIVFHEDPRIKYVYGHQHFGTFSKVANITISHATGDIIYLMGSDDVLAPGALYSVNEVFEADRFGPCWLYGKTISADNHLRFQGEDGAPTTYDELLQHNRIGCPSVFWNRRMMNLAGPFNTRYKWAADYEMWLRFWRIREPIFLNRELGIFRHHNDQMSAEKINEIEDEARRISQRYSMGRFLEAAMARWLTKKQYDGSEIPPSHDEIG